MSPDNKTPSKIHDKRDSMTAARKRDATLLISMPKRADRRGAGYLTIIP
jgi:hypothetical protein